MKGKAKRTVQRPKEPVAFSGMTSVADLTPDPRNARKHGDRNLEAITAALNEVGASRSIVIDEDGVILAGNATVKAAGAAGITKVQVVDVDGQTIVAVRRRGLTAGQKTRLALFDNRAAELAEGWDLDVLRGMSAEGIAFDGLWSDDEILGLIGGSADGEAGLTDPDALPAPRETDIRRGDVITLGDSRVMCGDATSAADVAGLLDGDQIDLVVSSPPYNVNMKYETHKDRTDRDTYIAFIGAAARAFVQHMQAGRFVAWNIGASPNTFPARQVVALEDAGLAFYRQIIWAKSGVPYPIFPSTVRTHRARHYKPNYTHEMIQVFESAEEQPIPEVVCGLCEGAGFMAVRELTSSEGHGTVQLMTHGDPDMGADNQPDKRYANDVWHIAQSQATVGLKTLGVKSSGLEKHGKKSHMVKEHPAAFPVELPRVCASFLTGVGEVVYDPFGGSGSTVIACYQLQRRARVMEIDPVYCQIIVDRWEAFTGKKATKVGEAIRA